MYCISRKKSLFYVLPIIKGCSNWGISTSCTHLHLYTYRQTHLCRICFQRFMWFSSRFSGAGASFWSWSTTSNNLLLAAAATDKTALHSHHDPSVSETAAQKPASNAPEESHLTDWWCTALHVFFCFNKKTLVFCLTGSSSWSYSKLGQSPKVNCCE